VTRDWTGFDGSIVVADKLKDTRIDKMLDAAKAANTPTETVGVDDSVSVAQNVQMKRIQDELDKVKDEHKQSQREHEKDQVIIQSLSVASAGKLVGSTGNFCVDDFVRFQKHAVSKNCINTKQMREILFRIGFPSKSVGSLD